MNWKSLKARFGSASERRHRLVTAGVHLGIALLLIGFALLGKIDDLGRVLTALIALPFAGSAAYQLWRARRSAPGSTVYYLPDLAPPDLRLVHTRRLLRGSAVVFPIASAWIAWDLWQLESGAAESVSVWAPVALVYRHFGFWPAALLLPALGTALGLTLRRKERALEGELRRLAVCRDAPR